MITDCLSVAIFCVSLHPMKEKLFITLLATVLCIAVAYPQARIILPDSSQITTQPRLAGSCFPGGPAT